MQISIIHLAPPQRQPMTSLWYLIPFPCVVVWERTWSLQLNRRVYKQFNPLVQRVQRSDWKDRVRSKHFLLRNIRFNNSLLRTLLQRSTVGLYLLLIRRRRTRSTKLQFATDKECLTDRETVVLLIREVYYLGLLVFSGSC